MFCPNKCLYCQSMKPTDAKHIRLLPVRAVRVIHKALQVTDPSSSERAPGEHYLAQMFYPLPVIQFDWVSPAGSTGDDLQLMMWFTLRDLHTHCRMLVSGAVVCFVINGIDYGSGVMLGSWSTDPRQ